MHFLEQAGWERVLELPGAGGILLAQILDAYLLNRIDHGLRGDHVLCLERAALNFPLQVA